MPAEELATLLRYFREGGEANLRALLRRLARHAGAALEFAHRSRCPASPAYWPGVGAVGVERLIAHVRAFLPESRGEATSPRKRRDVRRHATARPVVAIIFYRAALLAADTAPIDALCDALAARGLAPAPLVVTSLKETDAAEFVRDALAQFNPALIITTTAFAAGSLPGESTCSTDRTCRCCRR